ncbi:alpha 1,2-mannosyltransferase 2.4.1 [Savitreella phatthalungensis]
MARRGFVPSVRPLIRSRVLVVALVSVFLLYKLFNYGTVSSHRPVTTGGSVSDPERLSKAEQQRLAEAAAAKAAPGNVNHAAPGSAGDKLGLQDPVSRKGVLEGQNAAERVKSAGADSSDAALTTGYILENATFVTLARNGDLHEIVKSIRNVEDRFNRKYHYPWVFLNDEPFDDEFKRVTSGLVSGKTEYGLIPKDHWGMPDWIDKEKAAKTRETMREKQIIYGDSVSYRHMCRYESGFFYRHPLMLKYRYYWRVEPSIKMFCDFDYDPFTLMREGGKKYGFTISLHEYVETIETLWDTTKTFIKRFPEYVAKNNLMDWLSDDGGNSYNMCHFWSNFEIADADFWRGEAYSAYFDALDNAGGFFYERWGDAPVHSIAAGLFLNKDEVHFFHDMGYWHVPFLHCPVEPEYRTKCHCDVKEAFDWKGWSCTGKFHDVTGLKKPSNWKEFAD